MITPKKKKLLLAAAVLSLAASFTALADNPAATQWVLSSAKATGAGGEAFVTSMRIVNPNAADASVKLTFLPQSSFDGSGSALGDNSGQVPVTVTVKAGQTLALEDVLTNTFRVTGAGGILAETSASTPVYVLSRTYVANAKSSTGAPGTYGLSIPAQVNDQAVSVGDTAYLAYVSASPSATSGFRSNVIFLNTVNANTTFSAKLLKADGTSLGTKTYTLGKRSAAQLNNIASSVFGYSSDDQNLTLVVTVTSGGPVVIGATIIDNAISSLNYAGPTKVFLPNNGAFGLILHDGGYDLSGRLEIVNGTPNYLSGTFVLDSCTEGPSAFLMQASGSSISFTRNADGSFGFTGGSSTGTATWSGTIFNYVDGTVYGTINYGRTSTSDVCKGVTKAFQFYGSRGEILVSN